VARSKEFTQAYDLFLNLTQRELKGKYKRTLFGQLWSLANPLALMLVYTFVFAFVLRIDLPKGEPSGLNVFSLWLLCGLLPWVFFSSVVMQGMNSLIANEALIRKVYFPRSIVIYSSVAALAVNWSFEMLVLVVALVVVGAYAVILWVPIVILFMGLLAIFAVGIVLALSIANVYFRDTQYFVGIMLQLGMYLTPIVYPVTLVQNLSQSVGPLLGPITLLDIYQINPMYSFTNVFRSLLYNNAWPTAHDTVSTILWAAVALAMGLLVFNRNQKKLAELL
jgi:lipopolysaccharide transport system permease protein